jgi:DNA-binding transcriptional MerR regulator
MESTNPIPNPLKADIKEIDRRLHGAAVDDKDIRHLEALLTEWDARFEELQTRIAHATEETRAEYQKQLHALMEKRALASGKLKELREHTGELWGVLKHGLEHTWEEIRHEAEHLAARFKHEETTAAKGKDQAK